MSNEDATYLADGTETATCSGCELTDTRTAEGSKLEYTYTEMNATMYTQQAVNVRDLPDTSGNKIGSLSTNDEITISAKCNETGWYQFEYNGRTAFVSDKYVGENKVEIQQAPADNNTAGTGSAASHWYDGYQLYTWYDMGEYFFYLTPTQPEANQACGDCINGREYGNFLWQSELWSRYPDRKVSYFSNGASGFGIAVVCSNYEDENGFFLYRPKFLWE